MSEVRASLPSLSRDLCIAITQDPRLRELLEAIFEADGADLMTVSSVEQATAWVWRSPASLIVCDTVVEARVGLDPYREVVAVARERSVPLLVITPWRELMFEREHFLLDEGTCCSVVFRPISSALLLDEVGRLLRIRHSTIDAEGRQG